MLDLGSKNPVLKKQLLENESYRRSFARRPFTKLAIGSADADNSFLG